jgi:hypothetical protein
MSRWLVVGALLAVPVLAHAECGWLLMVPRIFDQKTGNPIEARAAINAPLSEWVQDVAFDSAEKCEETRGRLLAKKSPHPADVSSRCLPASMVPVK